MATGHGYARMAGVGETLAYLGCLVTLHARASETGGQLSLAECVLRPGVEPPPHVHAHEDEGFYVLEGELEVQVGERRLSAPAGTFVWAPRGVSHTFEVQSDVARALILTTPGGFLEAMFEPFSAPVEDLSLPPFPDEPPVEEMLALDHSLGITYINAPQNVP